MSVIIQIQGREAIPVRAIPLLTDWKEMSPDAVAKALAGDEHYYYFAGLCAYRIEDGATKPIRATWWQGFAVRNLKALSDRIEADQVTHEAGHQKWRKESLAELPAGVFVWKDEYVPMYESRYGPDEMARILGRELTPSEIQARELDFDPYISAEYAALVKENFAYQQHAPAQTAKPGARNVIIQIKGREAIPVRAIPLLTNWTVLAPEELVKKLKQGFIHSRHLEGDDVVTIRPDWWVDSEVALDSLSKTMEAKQCDYSDWQVRSTQLLPESAFVWRSEFEQFFDQAFLSDEADSEYLVDMHPAILGINYKPLVSRELGNIVMQGFDAPVPENEAAQTTKPEPVASVKPASNGPAHTKRSTWWDVSSQYIVETMRAGQYATAKELYNALVEKAGLDSPFDKGTGNNRFSLFIRKLSAPLALKTVQNNWQKLLEAAAKK